MILQAYIPKPRPEIHTGKKITLAGQAVDMTLVMQQYRRGSIEERAIGFYEQSGMVVPQFDRMTKIEKLMALNDYRKQAYKHELDLTKFMTDAEKKKAEAEKLFNLNKQKDEQRKNAGKASDHNAS